MSASSSFASAAARLRAAAPITVSLQHRLLATLNVRQEEARAVQWLFLHHFFQGFGLALFFTVANALFLAQFAFTQLPGALLTAAGALLVVGRLYAWLEHRLPLRRLLPGVVLTLVGLVLLAWLGVSVAGVGATAFALVVAHRVIYLLTNLEFWGLSALLLDVRQGKRLFGLISAGDVPAKLLGYLVVAALGPAVGLPNLLVLAAASFAASLPVLARLLQSPALTEAHEHGHHPDPTHRPKHHPDQGHSPDYDHSPKHDPRRAAPAALAAFATFFGSPFIVALAGLSFVAVIGFTCIDFAFLGGAQQRYGGAGRATELAYFLGIFLGFGKALTIVTKLFFSGRIVERLGVKRALLLPPALLLLLALGTAAVHAAGGGQWPMFVLFGALMLVAETFRYTLHDPIFLALFQPLSRHLRLHGHTTIKGIVDPLALAAAGVLLAGLIRVRGGAIEPTDVNGVLIVLLVGWGALVLLVSRQYLATLSGAIKRRFLDGGQVLIGGRAATEVVEAKLASSHPEEVIYAIELLVRFRQAGRPSAALGATLAGLLHHPSEAVRRQALERLDAAALLTARPAVLALARDPTEAPGVRAAAVGALSQLTPDAGGGGESAAEGPSQALPFLDDPDPTVRRAAITGLLRAGGLEGVVLAGQQLLRLVEAPGPASRALAAGIIGELGVRNFYQPIAAFLHDADPAVRRAAVVAAGQLANPRLLPAVLDLLADATLGEEAARALTDFGEAALPALTERLHGAAVAFDSPAAGLRTACVQVVGRIGGEAATALLTELLVHDVPTAVSLDPTAPDTPNRRFHEAVLRALRTAGYQAPPRGVVRETLHGQLDEQLRFSAWCLHAVAALGADAAEPGPADSLSGRTAAGNALPAVRAALLEEMTSARERLFQLLTLLTAPRTVLKIRAGLESVAREQAANALEILGHVLPPRLSAPLALLLETLPLPEKLRLLTAHVPAPDAPLTAARVLTHVLRVGPAGFHRWTVAAALHALPTRAVAETAGLRPLLAPYRAHPDSLLRQTATVAGRRLAGPAAAQPVAAGSRHQGAAPADLAAGFSAGFPLDFPASIPADLSVSPMAHSATPAAGTLLEIEKVVVLKSTSVFADTPEHILVDVAAIVREERVTAGQVIFSQGDFGDAMYVIYQGEVRIHAGPTTFATFRNRDLFGELALLDPEPRSASATATADSLLLRLDQEAFYELMAERREVAQGILRMLTKRLRAQNQLLAGKGK